MAGHGGALFTKIEPEDRLPGLTTERDMTRDGIRSGLGGDCARRAFRCADLARGETVQSDHGSRDERDQS